MATTTGKTRRQRIQPLTDPVHIDAEEGAAEFQRHQQEAPEEAPRALAPGVHVILDSKEVFRRTDIKRLTGASRQMALNEFSERLFNLMTTKGLSASDIARGMFGTTTNELGNQVAKGRDRVSHWVNAKKLPDAQNIQKLAILFGVNSEALIPQVTAPARGNNEKLVFEAVEGRPGFALIKVEKIVSASLAARIIAMLSEEK